MNYIAGQGREHSVVYVQLYAVQYNPVNMKAVLLTDAQIEISYTGKPESRVESSNLFTNAKNIILTIPEYKQYADSLKVVHETFENIATEVVTTDSVDSNYAAAPDPTKPGYANISTNPVNSNYKYNLAKKILTKNTDATFISCTALRLVDIVGFIENDIGRPVIASNHFIMQAALRKINISRSISDLGKLLSG